MMHPPRATLTLIHDLLRDVPKRRSELVFLTGESGSGKTAWCQALFREARQRALEPRGLISPGVFRDGTKTGIELVDLTSTSRRMLARKREQGGAGDEGAPTTESWLFDPVTLDWGEKILNQILTEGGSPEILIIDELGPLEFERHTGWVSGLALIDRRQYHLACVSLRPSLLDEARRRWRWGLVVEMEPGWEE